MNQRLEERVVKEFISTIALLYKPEDVFSHKRLNIWAEGHGYVRIEELLKIKEMMLKEDYENGA